MRNQSVYVAMILYQTLSNYETSNKFVGIIKIAMDKVNDCHLIDFLPSRLKTKCKTIIQDVRQCCDLFRDFCERDAFINPTKSCNCMKLKLPRLFDENPDILTKMIYFCRENINTLTVEAVHDFVSHDALPKLLGMLKSENPTSTQIMSDLLSYYGLRKLNIKMVQSWMKRLGFKHEPRKNVYCVDTHKTKENVAYISKYIKKYFQYKLLAHRWHSIPEDERERLIDSGD